jgi:hypothetical protein
VSWSAPLGAMLGHERVFFKLEYALEAYLTGKKQNSEQRQPAAVRQ